MFYIVPLYYDYHVNAIFLRKLNFSCVPFNGFLKGIFAAEEFNGLEMLSPMIFNGNFPMGEPNIKVLPTKPAWPAMLYDLGLTKLAFKLSE